MNNIIDLGSVQRAEIKMEFMGGKQEAFLLQKSVSQDSLQSLFKPVLWRKHLFSKSLHRRKHLLMEDGTANEDN